MAKRKSKDKQAATAGDPYAGREAEKYEKPIPSREFILQQMARSAEPVSHAQLCEELGLDDEDQQEALRRRLIAMSRDGQLISNRRGVYGLVDRMELLRGRVHGNKEGYGFFVPQDGSGDLFLGPREMQKVFDGDIVLARVSGVDRRGRREGMIVEVLERSCTQLVGRYYSEDGLGVVVPDNRRINQEILVVEKDSKGAGDGQFVVVEITAYPDRHRKTKGRITEILGDHMTPGMEIDVAIRSHDLPWEWPVAVTQAAEALDDHVPAEEIRQRVDLRDLPFVTIDGEDAKDFDDAVFCERASRGGYKLYVAVADVSHYVTPGSPLDREAQNRGNSVYFPGHVIPMLPEKLSNGLCSLRPDVDRLTMVCEMQVSRAGRITNYWFYEAVIHSHARLTYTEYSDMMEEQSTTARRRSQKRLRKHYGELVPHLELLYELYKKLAHVRRQAGSLDFGSNETRIVFGETRKIREIVPVERNDAHRLIEECMLAANVCTARFLDSARLPVLYRVHEGPNEEKLDNLREYLRELGIVLSRHKKPKPRDFQRVLQQAADRPDRHLIETMLVRSMLQAVYQPDNIGHFGLGFDAYTHFTSPIRRYPDLLIHRALRYLIRRMSQWRHVRKARGAPRLPRKQVYPYDREDMQQFGEFCSMTERRADDAVDDVVEWLKCEYVSDRVGEEFDGTVAGVTGFGIFVTLDGIYVEGLVHITELRNDYYQFDPVHQLLRGQHSGVTYHLGDAVKVRIARVDLDERKIDLVLAEDKPASKRRRRKGSGGRGKSKAVDQMGEASKSAKSARKGAGEKSGKKSESKDKPKDKSKGQESGKKNVSKDTSNTDAAGSGKSRGKDAGGKGQSAGRSRSRRSRRG